jgi:hypothetical protein
MVSWGPNYDGGGLTGLGSGVAAATSRGPDHGDDLAPGRSSGDGSSLTMRWGPDLEKQQWHRGALTVVTVASQGPGTGGGLVPCRCPASRWVFIFLFVTQFVLRAGAPQMLILGKKYLQQDCKSKSLYSSHIF